MGTIGVAPPIFGPGFGIPAGQTTGTNGAVGALAPGGVASRFDGNGRRAPSRMATKAARLQVELILLGSWNGAGYGQVVVLA